MKKQKKQAFTLVELIVVIIILAILWTIAFIALQWYSRDARDSARLSDLSRIKTSLELFYLDANKYPETTQGFNVTYSGAWVWTQGTFWDTTFQNVSKLDKIPVDPLTQREYTYSIIQTKQEFQLWWIMEGDGFALTQQTFAWDTLATAIVTWNYNGKILKTQSWVTCEILSVPSIISNQPSTTTNLVDILTNKWLVYNGYKNLPSNYALSKYKADGGFDFVSNKLVVYSDHESCSPLYDAEDNTARIDLIWALKRAYKWTLIEWEDGINSIVNLSISDLWLVSQVSNSFVNNNLWWNLDISNNLSTCSWIYWNPNPDQWWTDNGYTDFDLCDNTLLTWLSNISSSSNLTWVNGARDVYKVVLEEGVLYTFETFWDDNDSDTAMFLYDKSWNKLAMNDDQSWSIYRSKFEFTTLYTWYYYIWVMWYDDGSINADYTLSILAWWSCLPPPGTSNTIFITWNPIEADTPWQNLNSNAACYYACSGLYEWEDCGTLGTYTDFITTWNVGIDTWISWLNKLTLPLQSNGIYYFTVDWWDGNSDLITQYNQPEATHTYAGSWPYDVTISGKIYGFAFNEWERWDDNLDDADKLVDIKQWWSMRLANTWDQFSNAENLISISASDSPDLSTVTNLSYMFGEAYSFNGDISWWDVSNVTNMQWMFVWAENFNQPLNSWDVSSVTNMNAMFSYSKVFNQPLNSWNVSNVTDMAEMFVLSDFTQDVSSWNTSKVIDMSNMFNSADFNHSSIWSWDVSSVTNMARMFQNSLFNQDLSWWNTSNVINMSYMFAWSWWFNQNIGWWNTSSVANMSGMFSWNGAFNQNIGWWNTSSVTTMDSMFDGAIAFNQNIGWWNTSNVEDMWNMFKSALNFDQNIWTWNVSNVTDMYQMFYGANVFNQNISSWNTSNVIYMRETFRNAVQFNQDLSSWNVTWVTNCFSFSSGTSSWLLAKPNFTSCTE